MRLSLLVAAVFCVFVILSACGQQPAPFNGGIDGGGAGGGGVSDAATDGGLDDAGHDAGNLPPGPDCTGKTGDAGTYDWSLSHDGKTRTYRVHIPVNYDRSKKTPVVFNFHGYTSSGAHQEQVSGLTAIADREGFFVVYADGLRGYETGLSVATTRSWNAGTCCAEAERAGTDDVGFVAKMMDTVEDRFCVDGKRVYAMGFSNGGMLSHRLGCELSDRFAAIGPVASPNAMTTCTPLRAVPVMHFHGTEDAVVAYNGNAFFIPVRTSMADWAQRNGCDATPVVLNTRGDVTCERYPNCSAGADTVLCTVADGGHQWPGGEDIFLGHRTMAVSASEDLWEFFKNHPMP